VTEKYGIKCWCGTMVESIPMLLGYFDEKGHNHDPNVCELGELRKLRDSILVRAFHSGPAKVIDSGGGSETTRPVSFTAPNFDDIIERATELKRIAEGCRRSSGE
jgi:hypothetical protein